MMKFKIKQSKPGDVHSIPHGPEDLRVEIAKDQEQYRTLHAIVLEDNQTIICWKLSWRTRIRLLLTGKLWHSVMRSGPLQPMLVTAHQHDHYVSDDVANHPRG
jgi:hypothetical protein